MNVPRYIGLNYFKIPVTFFKSYRFVKLLSPANFMCYKNMKRPMAFSYKINFDLIMVDILTILHKNICSQYLASGWWGHYDFRCQLVDYSRSPRAMRVSVSNYYYIFMKSTYLKIYFKNLEVSA